jgi:hypothetical protein
MYLAIYEHWPDPMTALVGVAAAGVGLQGIGMMASGQAASAEAKSQQAIANYNAAVAEQTAKSIENQTLYKQQLEAENAVRVASSMRAAIGASGASPSEGTPLMVMAKQAAQSELDQLMTGYQGQIGMGQARSQGTIDRMLGDVYGQKAKNSMMAGMIGAGSTLLTGWGDLGMKAKNYYGESLL